MYIQIGLFHRYYRGFLMIYAFIYSMKHLLLDIYKGSSYVLGFSGDSSGRSTTTVPKCLLWSAIRGLNYLMHSDEQERRGEDISRMLRIPFTLERQSRLANAFQSSGPTLTLLYEKMYESLVHLCLRLEGL